MSEQQANFAEGSQNAPQSLLGARTATKAKRKSRKPQAIKTAVIALRTQGKTITSIANELGMTRNTTRGILEETDIDRQLEDGRIGCLRLIPKSIDAIDTTLSKGDGYLGIKLLTGLGILGTEQKPAKPQAPTNLHLQIMNLVGQANTENKAVTPSTSTIAVPDNSAIDV